MLGGGKGQEAVLASMFSPSVRDLGLILGIISPCLPWLNSLVSFEVVWSLFKSRNQVGY
jgi:hypothetical protein